MNTQHIDFTNDSLPLNPNFKMISRSDMKSVTAIEVEGENTYLGELRNFKSTPYLEDFLPEDFSVGWVKLPAGKTLKPHYHPCSSLIIVTKGIGVSLGDTVIDFKEGDIIHIPAWNLHGFEGAGKNGFEGLSIQFQKTAIFESSDRPETTYFDREKIPLDQRQLIKFEREHLESINSVEIQNEIKNLGIVKNFRSNSLLSSILPNYFSAAWVHLNDGEELKAHQHAEKSIILITNGQGEAFNGQESHAIETGDGVFVPPYATHGFRGKKSGFWGLSIQFNSTSLYENEQAPRVHFISAFEKLKASNEEKFQELKKLPIFNIPSEAFLESPAMKRKLLDCLQIMSRNFQTLMFSRVALANSIEYKKVYIEHLQDELGHDTELEAERGVHNTPLWDPILEASTSWFLSQNYMIDDPKRIIMISMILEKCAGAFYGHFANILKDELRSDHIENHSEADPYHENLGLDLIKNDCELRLEEFTEFQAKAWDILFLYLERKGELVLACK